MDPSRQTDTVSMEHIFRQRIESAGAVFVKLQDGKVYFRDAPDKPVISLYAFCCDHTNIHLAIKGQREQLSLDRWQELVGPPTALSVLRAVVQFLCAPVGTISNGDKFSI